VSFWQSPSLFLLAPKDRVFLTSAWAGVLLSCAALLGIPEYRLWSSILVWAILWLLYLSFVNVGQTFYAFGWESILLETGFFTIFSGTIDMAPQMVIIWIWRWILFRVMFGAGLIKLRADPCWRKLTCLDYHFETQPIPNPLSWRFHHFPVWVHKGGVLFNHFVELVVPFAYFAPQPVAMIAGLLTILFQVILMLSGNLAWLNLITIVLAISTLDGSLLSRVLPLQAPVLHEPALAWRITLWIVAAAVVWLSVRPVRNLFSKRQLMNFSYNPFHLVGTYGAFGGVTRIRNEIVLEGTADDMVWPGTEWKEYEFKGKPGNPSRRPPQIAPYHLRLDWLIWFAAMNRRDIPVWFIHFAAKVLDGDPKILRLLKANPFPDAPPKHIRALMYEYRFTTPEERRRTGQWWHRTLIGVYLPASALQRQTSARPSPSQSPHVSHSGPYSTPQRG